MTKIIIELDMGKMPKSCQDCLILGTSGAWLACSLPMVSYDTEELNSEYCKKRHEACPLEEV